MAIKKKKALHIDIDEATPIPTEIPLITLPVTDKEREKEEKKELKLLNKRQQTFIALRQIGKSQKDAYIQSGYKPKNARVNGCTLEAKIRTRSLTQTKFVRLAHQAIQDTLRMQPVTQEVVIKGEVATKKDYPTHSNRLQAAQIVLERAEPTVLRHENLNIQVEVSPVDLSQYRQRFEPAL